jgi:hypothetical protein
VTDRAGALATVRVTVEAVEAPAEVLDRARAHLARDPVRHNLVLTVLENRAAHPEPGRYWVAADDGRTVGVALQSPLTFAATCTPMAADAVAAAVDAIAAAGVELPGLVGDALTAARFAGQWTERTGRAAWPIQGQRLYEVDRVVPAVDRWWGTTRRRRRSPPGHGVVRGVRGRDRRAPR